MISMEPHETSPDEDTRAAHGNMRLARVFWVPRAVLVVTAVAVVLTVRRRRSTTRVSSESADR